MNRFIYIFESVFCVFVMRVLHHFTFFFVLKVLQSFLTNDIENDSVLFEKSTKTMLQQILHSCFFHSKSATMVKITGALHRAIDV